MRAFGSSLPKDGGRGSVYTPTDRFQADSLEDIDVVFNEVEDNTVMMTVMRAVHLEAYKKLKCETDTADQLGKTGTNIYRCTGYCTPQHTDKDDVCCGCCITTNWNALPGEYSFCFPSYGYYIKTRTNTFWCVL
ncbi:hypothetical protein R3P38DRAFT_2526866 [Favolaschia claudopus]|uniref:Uncharacterized protein n=1 Tax=Favolaschia claudopus TaxID=2862362 RepID=A0AAW0BMI6_9AGAR